MYDIERTICNILRSRNSMETQVFQVTLKMYATHISRKTVLMSVREAAISADLHVKGKH